MYGARESTTSFEQSRECCAIHRYAERILASRLIALLIRDIRGSPESFERAIKNNDT